MKVFYFSRRTSAGRAVARLTRFKSLFKKVTINASFYTFTFSLLFLFSFPVFAQSTYQDSLIVKSRELKLSQNSKWLNMVYYEKSKFAGNYESIFDSKEFFLSPLGKTNPQAELEATISGFFDSNLKFQTPYKNNQNAICAFKGRYDWLKIQLNFDSKKLPELKCADFEKWKKDLNAKSATLIFASAYLNNPASMFGHTFLLLNSDDRKETKHILSRSINYSANTAETNGVKFAYKGLFGFYEGKFSILEYHEMLKKYSNLENRDIWEYDLNLNQMQIDEILKNIWEIGRNHADYYFFSENCSYILLKLLKIVDNNIKIDKRWANFVIPSETVVAINSSENLIINSKYRPSRASNILHLMQNSDENMINSAKILSKRNFQLPEQQIFDNFSPNQQKITYDLAYEYLQYSYQKDKKMGRNEMAKTAFLLLNQRSKIAGKTEITEIKTPKTDPLLSHASSRVSAKYGYNNIRKDFIKFSSRQAYHDLVDNDNGFLKGAQINIFDFDVNYYFEQDRLKLEQFDVFNIKSFSPQNALFKPLSWQLEIGAKNLYFSEQDLKLAAFMKLGAGLNFEFEPIKSNLTILLNGSNYYGKHIETRNLTALTPEINLAAEITENLKLNFNFQQNFFKQETQFNSSNFKIESNYSLQKNWALNGYFERKDYKNLRDENEFALGLKYYY